MAMQTVCKGYKQTTKFASSKERVNNTITLLYNKTEAGINGSLADESMNSILVMRLGQRNLNGNQFLRGWEN